MNHRDMRGGRKTSELLTSCGEDRKEVSPQARAQSLLVLVGRGHLFASEFLLPQKGDVCEGNTSTG
jgi:hypothetical protein